MYSGSYQSGLTEGNPKSTFRQSESRSHQKVVVAVAEFNVNSYGYIAVNSEE